MKTYQSIHSLVIVGLFSGTANSIVLVMIGLRQQIFIDVTTILIFICVVVGSLKYIDWMRNKPKEEKWPL